MARVCPDCNLALAPKSFRGVTVDTCPRCAGIYFDEGEVNRLRVDGNDRLTEVEEAVRPAEDFVVDFQNLSEQPRKCPNCKTDMDKMRYLYNSPVMLDSCPNCCGVWVEDGELKSMREVLDSQGARFGTKVRTEAYVAKAQTKPQPEDSVTRVKRLERAMRLFGKRASY